MMFDYWLLEQPRSSLVQWRNFWHTEAELLMQEAKLPFLSPEQKEQTIRRANTLDGRCAMITQHIAEMHRNGQEFPKYPSTEK